MLKSELQKKYRAALERLGEMEMEKAEMAEEAEELQAKVDSRDHLLPDMEPQETDVDEYPDLPLPRLQIVWREAGPSSRHYTREWAYSMVYKHFGDSIVKIYMSVTRTDDRGEMPMDDMGSMNFLPYRDGAHIHWDKYHLRLPAFAINSFTGEVSELLGDGDRPHIIKIPDWADDRHRTQDPERNKK